MILQVATLNLAFCQPWNLPCGPLKGYRYFPRGGPDKLPRGHLQGHLHGVQGAGEGVDGLADWGPMGLMIGRLSEVLGSL